MMLVNNHILTLIVFVPLVGAALLALLPARGRTMQWGALIVTLVTFLLTLHLPAHYDYAASGMQFQSNHLWLASPTIRYHLGVDGLSLWLIVLLGFLAPFGVLASWRAIGDRTKEFYVLFLVQQTAMLGVFVALDLFLFYGFWELSLVPMTLLIAIFGRTENRRRAAMKYFLYTFITSALLLVAILWLYARTGTFDYATLAQMAAAHQISNSAKALWLASLAFLLAFATKVPVFPLHGWLSDAISEAPTAAAMVLVGELGLYAILRFSLGIFPSQSHYIAPLMIALGAIGVVYGALIALAQTDIKRLIAYASLSHVSFIVLGIFGFTIAGIDGAIYQIINHGISGGALLMLAGFLYERYQTYDMRDYGGLAQRMPWMVTLFAITTLGLIGLPMFNGFIGEFLILSGTFQTHPRWTILVTVGVILGAAYMLWMVQRIFYGNVGPKIKDDLDQPDLGAREQVALWPLAVIMLLMGVFSPFWMQAIDASGVSLANKSAALAAPRVVVLSSATYAAPDSSTGTAKGGK